MEQPNQKDPLPQHQDANQTTEEIPDWNQNYLPNIPVPEDYSYVVELTQRFDIDSIYANFMAQAD